MPGRGLLLVLAALAVLGALLLAGCGGGSSGTSATTSNGETGEAAGGESESGTNGESESGANSPMAMAEKGLQEALAGPTKFEPPGPAFDASEAKGKTVYIVAADLSVPFIKELTEGAVEALRAVGVKAIVTDHKDNPATANRLIEQGVSRHVNAIITQSLPAAVIAPSLEQAKAAGIPVVQVFETDPAPPSAEAKKFGVSAQATECSGCGGEALIDWATVDSEGNINGIGIENSGISISKFQVEAMNKRLGEVCPGCTLKWEDVQTPENWATKLPTLTQTAVQDQSVNYLFPVYDNMAEIMVPSVQAGNAAERVQIASYNGDRAPLELLKKGEVIAAISGTPNVWLGWGAADQALRLLTGNEPLDSEEVPMRLFDASNIDSIDLSEPQDTWFNVNFKAGYEKLWGVG